MVDFIIVRTTKVCKKCGGEKSIDDFDFEPRVRDQRAARCSACRRAYNLEWERAHPERAAVSKQRYRDTQQEKDRASRKAAAKRQNEKRQEERNLARLERGLWPLPPRSARILGNDKLCTDCRQYKPLVDFSISGAATDGIFSYCKPCTAARAKEARKAATEEQREKRRINFRRYSCLRLYGIGYDEVERMFAEQSGLCPICGGTIHLDVPRKDPKGAGIDHCHTTQKVRGILCIKCNLGLGAFRDNEDHLAAAIAYLRRSRMED